jgi:hypothetical protein
MATITVATNADPCVMTYASHSLQTGDAITLSGGTGAWAAVNGVWHIVKVDADKFSIAVDSTGFGALSITLTIYFTELASALSIQNIKTFLEIVSTEHDTKLGVCLNAASALVETYCDRKFSEASYTPAATPDDSLIDGKGLPFVYTPQWPIITVTALKWVNEGNNGDIQSFGATQYAVHKALGKITLLPSATLTTIQSSMTAQPVWPEGTQNIAVSYSAGFATLPNDLVQAIVIVAAHLHLLGNTRRLGAKSITMAGGGGSGSTSFAINDIPAEARSILDRYRAVIPR